MVEFAYNNIVHSSTEFTSLYLCYGQHHVNPANLVAQVETQNEATKEFMGRLHEDLSQTIQNLRKSQDRQKYCAGKKRRAVEFNIGDEALIPTRNLSPIMIIGGNHKLGPLHIGSFKIVKMFTSSYELELPVHMKIHPIFHASQLMLYKKHLKILGGGTIDQSQSLLQKVTQHHDMLSSKDEHIFSLTNSQS